MHASADKKIKIDFLSYEMTVNICGAHRKVFLQEGFFDCEKNLENGPKASAPLHRHSYPEIHLFVGDGIRVTLGNETLTPPTAAALIIPRLTYHALDVPSGALHCAFQIDTQPTSCPVSGCHPCPLCLGRAPGSYSYS